MSLAAIANLITITPYHKKGSHGTSLRRDVDPSSLINYGACRDITSGASQSLKERIRDNSSHSRPCGPVVVEVDHIFLRRCLSWCTKKWTLHRASPPPPSRANMSRFLGKQTPASKRCEWASLYTNPLENVHRLSRHWEGERRVDFNPRRSRWNHHEISRFLCFSLPCFYFYFFAQSQTASNCDLWNGMRKNTNFYYILCRFIK